MKALIFAAGIGSRLKPFTDKHPKALAPVDGVPMLERTLVKLKTAGVTDVAVNVHHFASQIKEFLQANNNFGLHIYISDETSRLLDTGGGLLKAFRLLDHRNDEPILLHNADILTDTSTDDMLAFHNRANADVTLLVSERASSRQLYFSSGKELCGWCNLKNGECKPQGFTPAAAMKQMAFGGIHIVQPSIRPRLEEYSASHGDAFSIIPFYLEFLHDMRILGFTPSSPFVWHDIGTPEKLAAAEATLRKNHNNQS